MYRILLTGGGSGGHVYPLVAVAEELQKQAAQNGADLKLRFIGDDGFFKNVAGEIGVSFKNVLSAKWRRYASLSNFIDIFKLPVGFFQSLYHVWKFMPDLIFSKGGYDSVLPILVGKLFMIPAVLHESDAIPGKANLWLARFAQKIFLSFDAAKTFFPNKPAEVVGNPLRAGILNFADKTAAVSAFGLNPAKLVVLITGASQGAKAINDILALSLVKLAREFQIIHQCGPNNYEEVSKQTLAIIKEGEKTYGSGIRDNYRLYPSFDLNQMALAYAASDVIVGRAGAATVFEIAAVGKPAVIVPLKNAASGHQLANAREFAKFGATVIEEDNLTSHILINEIQKAFEKRAELSQKIKQFARPDAAEIIARQLLGMLKQ